MDPVGCNRPKFFAPTQYIRVLHVNAGCHFNAEIFGGIPLATFENFRTVGNDDQTLTRTSYGFRHIECSIFVLRRQDSAKIRIAGFVFDQEQSALVFVL